MAAELRPAYLIHGDDHGAVAERRAGLRTLVESEGLGSGLETLEGEHSTPAALAVALSTLTFSTGRRVLIVDGVERWKQADVEGHLAGAIAEMAPETTVALFAREEPRAKAPQALHAAVERVGGQIIAQMTVKPWELPRWVRERAARVGIVLDADSAKALIAQVGERQQRLLRELEKLALELESSPTEARVRVDAQQIEERTARSSALRAYELAEALLRGDRREAVAIYLRLREQGERLAGLVYPIASRMREALEVAVKLAAGKPAAEVRRSLRMPPKAADRFLAQVARTDPARLRAALGVLADLELDTRGGSPVQQWRSPQSSLREDTQAVRALEAICA